MDNTTATNVFDFLAHYGVQGMKWGQRKAHNKAAVAGLQSKGLSKRQAKNTNRYQNAVDAQRMTAKGKQGKVGNFKQMQNRNRSNTMLSLGTVVRHPLSAEKAAVRQLDKNKEMQAKIGAGKSRVTATLLKAQGIRIDQIDYSTD